MAAQPETYDEKRANAPLVQCAACGLWWYMTPVMETCVLCQQKAAKAKC
jgi:hypothetical protein